MSLAIMQYVGVLVGLPAPFGLLALVATAGVAALLAFAAFVPLIESVLPIDAPAEAIVLLPGLAAGVGLLAGLAWLFP